MVNEMYTLWINPHEKRENQQEGMDISQNILEGVSMRFVCRRRFEIANVNGMRKM